MRSGHLFLEVSKYWSRIIENGVYISFNVDYMLWRIRSSATLVGTQFFRPGECWLCKQWWGVIDCKRWFLKDRGRGALYISEVKLSLTVFCFWITRKLNVAIAALCSVFIVLFVSSSLFLIALTYVSPLILTRLNETVILARFNLGWYYISLEILLSTMSLSASLSNSSNCVLP